MRILTKRIIAGALVASVLVSTAAFAVFPVLALSPLVTGSLLALFGATYAVATSDISTSHLSSALAAPFSRIRVVFQLDDSVSETDLISQYSDPVPPNYSVPPTPSSVTPGVVGPFKLTLTVNGSSYVVQGSTTNQLLTSMMLCPSHICGTYTAGDSLWITGTLTGTSPYGLNSSNSTIARKSFIAQTYWPQYYPNWKLIPVAGPNPGLILALSPNTAPPLHQAKFEATGGVSCPSGYSYNGTTYLCDLTSTQAAAVAAPSHNVCVLKNGQRNPFNPNCAALEQAGLLEPELTPDGDPVVVLKNPDDNVVIAQRGGEIVDTFDPRIISRTKEEPGTGVKTREDVPYARDGRIGSGGIQQIAPSPTPHIPAYPGQPISPTAPPQTIPTQTAVCGGPGLPACSVALDPSALAPLAPVCGGPGLPACAVSIPAEALTPLQPVCGGPGLPACSVTLTNADDGKTKEAVTLGEDFDFSTEPNATDGVLGFIRSLATFQPTAPAMSCEVALDTASNSVTLPVLDIEAKLDLAEACPLVTPHESTIRQLALSVWFLLACFAFIRYSM